MFTIEQVESVISNQLQAEEQMGADETQLSLLKAYSYDLVHLLKGGYIVNGYYVFPDGE